MFSEPVIGSAVRTFDAIVLGAGPGGAAASLMLHDPSLAGQAGSALKVLMVEARPAMATRGNVVLLQPDLVGHLRTFDLLDEVLPSAHDLFRGAGTGREFGVASLARIENALRGKVAKVGAETGGIEAAYESTIDGVRHLADGSVEAQLHRVDGTTETIRAAAIVDATGGRSGLLAPATGADPRYFLTGHLPFQPDLPAYQRTELAPVAGEAQAPWLLGFNHSVDGQSSFVQLPSADAAGATPAQQAAYLAGMLERAGLHGQGSGGLEDALTGVHVVTSPTGLAPAAARDGVYAIGDGVGLGSPVHGNGVSMAFEDASNVTMAVQSVVDHGLPPGSPPEAIRQARTSIEQMYDQVARMGHSSATIQPPPLAGVGAAA